MKISSFDLNLFVILNAIYTEGSLTKAAEVVGITQPAVSNALARLRDKFNDDLFVRTGSGMVPTQKTENMIQDIQNALSLIQQSVNEPDTFDPSSTKRNDMPFVEIPIDIPSMEYFLIWHKSDEGDGGHIWMKDLIIKAFKDAQR